MDSGGLGECAQLYDREACRRRAQLLNATKRISDLLTITKLITVFEVFETEADAVRGFISPAITAGQKRGTPGSSRRSVLLGSLMDENAYLKDALHQFHGLKQLADRAIAQVTTNSSFRRWTRIEQHRDHRQTYCRKLCSSRWTDFELGRREGEPESRR
jgi:hypothetical protein